jgi:hypothetical protein
MNPAVKAMQQYVALVAPWASAEWTKEQFDDPKVREDRMSPVSTVFPIPSRPLPGLVEQLLLGPERTIRLCRLIMWVNTFNWQNERIERMVGETKWQNIVSLHAGIIGQRASGTLNTAWRDANEVTR